MPIARDLVDWLFWCWTVYLEAEGEPAAGKLAVAWVIRNRSATRGGSMTRTVLEPYQFSSWNTASPRRRALAKVDPAGLEACVAACILADGLSVDPTKGATHYLNVETVLRDSGKLPAWAADPNDPTQPDPFKVTAQIGRHTFLRLV